MKMRAMRIALVMVGVLGLIGLRSPAAQTDSGVTPVGLRLGPGSALWIEGKSNLHEFESRTTTVGVKLTRGSGASAPATPADLESLVRGSSAHGLEVEVPVKSLHSKKEGIDKNLWKDLRADDYPTIQFHLTKYTVSANEAKRDTTHLRAEGMLRIAGKERPVTLSVRAYRGDDGLWIDGSERLKMTDYGIKPRTMMLGTLRVKDEVVVRYHLLLIPKEN